MKKVLTIGGAMYDAFVKSKEIEHCSLTSENNSSCIMLPVGKKIEVDHIEYHVGGGAVNSAVSFAKMGFDVEAFFKCGNDPYAICIVNVLHSHAIKTHNIVFSHEQSTGYSFILPDVHGNHTVLAYRAANLLLQKSEIPTTAIEKTDALYITSLNGHASSLLLPIVSYAKEYHKLVAVNPGTHQLRENVCTLQESLPYIDILIVNECEAQLLMNSLHKQFSLEDFFVFMKGKGPSIVVVTQGKCGVSVYNNESILFQPSISTHVVSTVGAGDAFGSTFVACLMDGHDTQYVAYAGALNSSSVIQHIGAQTGLLTKEELNKKIDL